MIKIAHFQRDFWRNRFVILLVSIVAVILASPLADEEGGGGRVIIQVAFSFVVLFGVLVSSANRKMLIFIISLTTVWVSLALWSDLFGSETLTHQWARLAMLVAICVSIFVVVERAVLAAPVVDTNVICGGIACYLLIAITWALCFSIIEIFWPLSVRPSDGETMVFSDVMYFSLSCLTTLGFGDIVPVLPFARIWATLEAVTGTIYLSVLISRLVSLYRR